MLTTSRSDAHGNPVTGSAAAVDRYDIAVDHLLAFREDAIGAVTSLAEDEPGFPMGQILAAYASLLSTDVAEVPPPGDLAGRMEEVALDERESAHIDAIEAWSAGDWHGASRRLDDLLVRWPADLLGLLVGHQLDFFLGDASNLRDRIGRSLPSIDPSHAHHGYARGMYAFGLEESGHYDLALHHGAAALAQNPDDVWATHAVVHTYEMQGRIDEGIRFLDDHQDTWGSGNLFAVHNWWHYALYLLEAGRPGRALAVYDRQIHHLASAGVPLEMLDASALLWRLHVDVVDTGGRFSPLADAWAARSELEPWYVFNDLHAVMAFAGAGRWSDARSVIERLDAYVAAAAPGSSNVGMTAEVGLPACRAVLAHAEGRFGDAVEALSPVRRSLARFGGSHAQRDALQRTLVDAAIRAGELALARALVDERLGVRETSVWSWDQRHRILAAQGDDAGAAEAAGRASSHRSRFAAADGTR